MDDRWWIERGRVGCDEAVGDCKSERCLTLVELELDTCWDQHPCSSAWPHSLLHSFSLGSFLLPPTIFYNPFLTWCRDLQPDRHLSLFQNVWIDQTHSLTSLNVILILRTLSLKTTKPWRSWINLRLTGTLLNSPSNFSTKKLQWRSPHRGIQHWWLSSIKPHSLNLLRSEKRCGWKLLMKYDGPFEILQRLGPTTYRLHLPASYGIHPILNVAHLEPYVSSDSQFGPWPSCHMNRTDFTEVPEYEVDTILRQRWSRNRWKVQELLTRFTGYDASHDEWLTRRQLHNAPDILKRWDSQECL